MAAALCYGILGALYRDSYAGKSKKQLLPCMGSRDGLCYRFLLFSELALSVASSYLVQGQQFWIYALGIVPFVFICSYKSISVFNALTGL